MKPSAGVNLHILKCNPNVYVHIYVFFVYLHMPFPLLNINEPGRIGLGKCIYASYICSLTHDKGPVVRYTAKSLGGGRHLTPDPIQHIDLLKRVHCK